MNVFIVIPTYNEAKTIGSIVRDLKAKDYRIVIVDDGSGDGTIIDANKFGAELAQISVAIFALIWSIAFLAYAFQGIGKFAAILLPWDLSPHTYAVILMSVTTVYTILGGMYSVILTDVIQYLIMTICCFIVAWIAMNRVSGDALNALTFGRKPVRIGYVGCKITYEP